MYLELLEMILPWILLGGVCIVQVVFGALIVGSYERKNWIAFLVCIFMTLLLGICMGAIVEVCFL